MKTVSRVTLVSLLLVPVLVSAETLDGAKILEMEAEKARQIEDLEYQAKLIEQKAKLAKAYKQLKENGGEIPGEEGFGVQVSADGQSDKAQSSASGNLNSLPVLKSIGNGYALFEHRGKLFRAAPGGHLPGGFKVLSVSNDQGVRLKQGDAIYALDIAWATVK